MTVMVSVRLLVVVKHI